MRSSPSNLSNQWLLNIVERANVRIPEIQNTACSRWWQLDSKIRDKIFRGWFKEIVQGVQAHFPKNPDFGSFIISRSFNESRYETGVVCERIPDDLTDSETWVANWAAKHGMAEWMIISTEDPIGESNEVRSAMFSSPCFYYMLGTRFGVVRGFGNGDSTRDLGVPHSLSAA